MPIDVIFPDDLNITTPEIDDTLLISDTSDGGETKQCEVGDLPISKATQIALDGKVDKITGKGLSTNDYDNTEKAKVAQNTLDRHTHSNKSILDNTTASFTTEDETKLNGIENGAEVNITENVYAGVNTTIERTGKDITINSLGGPATITEGFNRNIFTATAGQTIFDLTFTYTPGNNEILVFVNGNILLTTTDYIETDNNTITLTSGVDAGDVVQVMTGIKGDKGESIFTIEEITTDVNPASPNIIYLVDATSGNITITLPNVVSGNTDEFRVILTENTHRVSITTVGGTQLIGGKTTQYIQTVNGQLYLKANGTNGYYVITDTREYYRVIELTGAGTTDLTTTGYESGAIYHCEPGTGNTRTIIIPDSNTSCYGNFAKFLLDGEGDIVLYTENNEEINGETQQTIIQGGFELTCFGDHYGITQDSRPKVQNTEINYYSLSEDSLISDGLGGFYKQTATSTDDTRFNKTTGTELSSPSITGANIYAYGAISDEGVIQGILPSGITKTTLAIRKISGGADFNFYIKLFHRNSSGTETLIGTSANSTTITSNTTLSFSVDTLINEDVSFSPTDRLIRKIYCNKVGASTSPVAGIIVEGTNPSFTTIGVGATSVSHNILAGLQLAGDGITYGHLTDTDQTIFGNKTFNDNLTITGDLVVNGTTTTLNTQEVLVEDNILTLNNGEVGSGVTAGSSGIEVDRGLLTNYEFKFVEATDDFRIGAIGNLQAVATREDTPLSDGFAYWNNTAFRFDTKTISTSDLSDNSSIVKTSGNQTITGTKEFSGQLKALITNASFPFYVKSTSSSINPTMRIENDSGKYVNLYTSRSGTTDGDFLIQLSDTSKNVIILDGRVLIGTGTPQTEKLYVSGTFKASSTITANTITLSGTSTDTAPTGASKYIDVLIGGVAYRILANAV